MKRTLYLKFVLAYFIFGFFGFIVVATFTSNMTLEHMKRERADALYKEALLISNSYAVDLYNSEITLESVWRQINAIDTFLDASVWIVNPSGLIVLDSLYDTEFQSHGDRKFLLYCRQFLRYVR